MSVYMIVDVRKIRNKQLYAEYVREVPATVKKFGGRYLARGGKAFAASGSWKPGRLVIVEFPSFAKFRTWWNSPLYRKIAPLRERSAQTNAVVVKGLEDVEA